MTDQQTIQNLLNEELTRIRLRNPDYSLRAFARKLKTSPSVVSEILQGKRRISGKLAERILDRLTCSPVERTRVLALFPRKGKSKEASESPPLERVMLDADRFNAISEWHHFALLSLAETEGFRSDPLWIARRLGLRKAVAESAVERLIRLGLLEKDPKGNIRTTGRSYTTTDEIASLSLRRSHAQNLELARASLERDPLDQRDFCAITMAIDPEKLPEAKTRIRKFRDELCSFLESDRKREVYKLCIQMIPLTVNPEEA